MKAPFALLGIAALVAVPLVASPQAVPDPPPAISSTASSARHTSPYQWPTGGEARVLRPFLPPALRWQSGHRGVDLESEIGACVYAAADGRVIYAGILAHRPVVSIEHADGIRTTYEPVAPLVRKGDDVAAGEVIGMLEAGHCTPRACLHWGAKRGADAYLDPLSLLRARAIRLLE